MAGSKVNDYGIGDVNATSIMTTLDTQRIGYHALSLTEYGTSTKPAIAAGSKIEINGALFKFDTEEAISGTPSDGDVYILISVSGSSATASFTNTAPTWSDSKQGWYGTGGNANYRYANFIMTKSGSNYTDKKCFHQDPQGNSIFSVFDADAFSTQSFVADGYVKIGPLYLQWGYEASPSNGTSVTFPVEFPNAVYSVAQSGGSASTAVVSDEPIYITNLATTGFDFTIFRAGTPRAGIYWIAVGY